MIIFLLTVYTFLLDHWYTLAVRTQVIRTVSTTDNN